MFLYENTYNFKNTNMFIVRNKNFSWQLHMHRDFELVVVTKGRVKVNIFEHDYILNENDTALIFPNQLHSYENIAESELVLCVFKPELVMEFSKKTQGLIPRDNSLRPVSGAWLKLYKAMKEDDNLEIIKGILYYYCGIFAKSHSFVNMMKSASKKYDLISKSFEFIDRNFKEKCNLINLAAYLNYDYSYLSKFFLKNVGLGFNEYVNRRRVEYSCYLLKNTDNDITEISENCGFENLRTFNRNFRKFLGCSPKDYRKKNKSINKN